MVFYGYPEVGCNGNETIRFADIKVIARPTIGFPLPFLFLANSSILVGRELRKPQREARPAAKVRKPRRKKVSLGCDLYETFSEQIRFLR